MSSSAIIDVDNVIVLNPPSEKNGGSHFGLKFDVD
jgi:hypothetical protein